MGFLEPLGNLSCIEYRMDAGYWALHTGDVYLVNRLLLHYYMKCGYTTDINHKGLVFL